PASDLFPRRIAARLPTADRAFRTELAQRARDRRSADGWERTLEIRISELLWQSLDRGSDHVALRTAPRARHSDAVFEGTVRLHEHHAYEVLPPGHQRMLPLVPALRRGIQRIVVALLRRFDHAFERDVPADFVARPVEQQQRQQARHAAVAVGERMDTEEI